MAVRLSDWRMAAAIAVATPVYLWAQRFLDGFMIPVEIMVNMALLGCMRVVLKIRKPYWLKVVLLSVPAFLVMLIGNTVAIWLVKDESIVRALIVAWNTEVYSCLSILGAALVCAPFERSKTK